MNADRAPCNVQAPALSVMLARHECCPADHDGAKHAGDSPGQSFNRLLERHSQHDAAGRPYRSFRGLIEHLATLPRNQVRFTGATADVPMLTEPTSAQREAFDLIGVPIPLALK